MYLMFEIYNYFQTKSKDINTVLDITEILSKHTIVTISKQAGVLSIRFRVLVKKNIHTDFSMRYYHLLKFEG